ncbi:MAG: T9SS type A sorting domain-containing protein [Candidatus Aegiribacteria sp.]|nr:T9SS type A sorting domain-containing protein [Candidatus Aegiribacteria sp.]
MDFNNDGNTDIIVGERNGYINFFERNSDGTLKTGVRLVSGGTVIDVGDNSAPDLVDWDNDGDLDMIVGLDYSLIPAPLQVYLNTGTASAYQFSGYSEFTAGGSVVNLARSMPSIYDMNGDGLFDVVVGATDGSFYYYQNTGTLGNPSFAANNPLKYRNGGDIQSANSDSRLDICDWNEDGYPDLVVGDYSKYVYLYYAYNPTSIEGGASGLLVPSALSMNANPVASMISVSINLGEAAAPAFSVYTMDGRAVLTHNTGTLNPGHNTVNIPISLPNGTYILHCAAGNMELTERFVVVR